MAQWLTACRYQESSDPAANLCKVKDLATAVAGIQKDLLNRVTNESLDDDSRVAAAQQAVMLQPDNGDIVDTVLELLTPQSSPEFFPTACSRVLQNRRPKVSLEN